MSTNTPKTSTTPRFALLIGLAAGLVVLIGGGLLLQQYGPGNMGTGFMTGGAVALIAAAVAMWRSTRRPETATTFERAFTLTGDERDDAVLTRALAVLGLSTLPITGVAAIAIALGAHAPMVLALLLFGQFAVVAVAFVVINRRS